VGLFDALKRLFRDEPPRQSDFTASSSTSTAPIRTVTFHEETSLTEAKPVQERRPRRSRDKVLCPDCTKPISPTNLARHRKTHQA